jgi:hypothetical protein
MADRAVGVAVVIYTSGGVKYNIQQSLDTATCFFETRDLSLGEVDLKKYLQRLHLTFSCMTTCINLKLYIKWRNTLNETLNVDGPYSLSSFEGFVPVAPPGANFFRLRFEDFGVTSHWHLSKIDMYGAVGGRSY